jgi:chromatin remodeling complex protein RSC6
MPSKKTSASKAKKTTPKKTTPKKTVQEAAPAPEPEPAPEPVVEAVPAPVAASTTEVSSAPTLEDQFTAINTKIAQLRSLESEIQSDLRKLQKATLRHIKDLNKKNKRKKVSPEDKKKRAPSGFAKPTVISNELCDFLGMTHGTEMARTEVTKQLTKYIKSNELQDESNRRRIIPDQKLKKLLNVGEGQEVTYFNLQKYMKVHFPSSKSQIALSSALSSAQSSA